MHELGGGSRHAEVALGLLHEELRRMGFSNTNIKPSDMVSAANDARVVRCFRDKGGRRVAVLENPGVSRSLRP
jgi:fido (protein-threonine AMPylation protein)